MRECRVELRALGQQASSGGGDQQGAAGRNALVLHLLCLYDHALVDGSTVDRCLVIYDGQ